MSKLDEKKTKFMLNSADSEYSEENDKENADKSPSLAWILFKMHLSGILTSMFLKLIETLLSISGPLILE